MTPNVFAGAPSSGEQKRDSIVEMLTDVERRQLAGIPPTLPLTEYSGTVFHVQKTWRVLETSMCQTGRQCSDYSNMWCGQWCGYSCCTTCGVVSSGRGHGVVTAAVL